MTVTMPCKHKISLSEVLLDASTDHLIWLTCTSCAKRWGLRILTWTNAAGVTLSQECWHAPAALAKN